VEGDVLKYSIICIAAYLTGNDFGEYYTTHANGRLSLYDNDGLISTAMPTTATSPKDADEVKALGFR
jgi:hypothetical protein